MNSTNILLGSTGFLLVVGLLFSYGQMNQGKQNASPQIAALEQEIARFEEERRELENQQTGPTLIFPQARYERTPTPAVVEEVEADDTADRMAELEERMREMAERNDDLEDRLAEARTPASAPVPEVIEEPIEEPEIAAVDPNAERRARLIGQALLQATVVAWDPEEYFIILEPTARANFSVNDELALRRNDGILCRFTVTREGGGQYVAVLKSTLAAGAPDIVPNDELILPPAYDGVLD